MSHMLTFPLKELPKFHTFSPWFRESPTDSGITGRGWGTEFPPDIFHRGNFADLLGKKGQGKKENEEENKENLKGKRWKMKMEVEKEGKFERKEVEN